MTAAQMWGYRVKCLSKAIARTTLGDYSIYRIYSSPAEAAAQRCSCVVEECSANVAVVLSDSELASNAFYGGEESYCFVIRIDDVVCAVAFYWVGSRYRTRGFIDLKDDEAKLVQIVTSPAKRGNGLATQLIVESTRAMLSKGWRKLYARVWHSNVPSRRAFERAGWRPAGWVVEINPLRLARAWKIRWGV